MAAWADFRGLGPLINILSGSRHAFWKEGFQEQLRFSLFDPGLPRGRWNERAQHNERISCATDGFLALASI